MHVQTVEEVECLVCVGHDAQEENGVQAANDHWVKSCHLCHHGIARQDKQKWS